MGGVPRVHWHWTHRSERAQAAQAAGSGGVIGRGAPLALRHNVSSKMPSRRPQLKLIAPDAASPEEAAAIVAALERFMRSTAPALTPMKAPLELWRRAAIMEGVEREPGTDMPTPWINT